MNREELQKLVDLHVSQLREHVDSVRIFVTTDMEEGRSETVSYDSGKGNFFAQLGQVQEWLCIQQQYQKNWAIAKDKENDS